MNDFGFVEEGGPPKGRIEGFQEGVARIRKTFGFCFKDRDCPIGWKLRADESAHNRYNTSEHLVWNSENARLFHTQGKAAGAMSWLNIKKDWNLRILSQPWIVPQLNPIERPAFNYTTEIRNMEQALDLLDRIRLYQLTILRDRMLVPSMFWLSLYKDIPRDYWNPQSRQKSGKEDCIRVLISKAYHNGHFQKVGDGCVDLIDAILNAIKEHYRQGVAPNA